MVNGTIPFCAGPVDFRCQGKDAFVQLRDRERIEILSRQLGDYVALTHTRRGVFEVHSTHGCADDPPSQRPQGGGVTPFLSDHIPACVAARGDGEGGP